MNTNVDIVTNTLGKTVTREMWEEVKDQYDSNTWEWYVKSCISKNSSCLSVAPARDHSLWYECIDLINKYASDTNYQTWTNTLGDEVDPEQTIMFDGCVLAGLEVLAEDAELEGEELDEAERLYEAFRNLVRSNNTYR